MIVSKLAKLTPRSICFGQSRGRKGKLPTYDPAAAIPMKWGLVYMGVFFGFWGVAYVVNPWQHRHVMMEGYEQKWQTKD